MVQIPSYGQTRFGPIRLEVGAQSVGRGKRVPYGGSHGHGVEVIMRTLEKIHRKLCFLPKPMEAALDPSREVRLDDPVPRSGRPHDTSFYSTSWMGSAMPNSSIGISSVIPRSGVGKLKQYTRLGTVGESRPRRRKQSSTNWSWRPWGVELICMLKIVNAVMATISGSASFCTWTGRLRFLGLPNRVQSPGGTKYIGSKPSF